MADLLKAIALGLALLIGAGCGSALPVPTPGPTPTPAPAATSLPTTSAAPTGSPASTPTPPMQPINRDAVLVEPEVVAQLLADPVRRADGVIALVAGLGIGIYTYDGRQILPGSETSEDDFLLYDFEVPLMAEMAAGEPEPFSNLHGILAAAGYSGSQVELAFAFSTAFTAAPDSF